MTIDAELLSRLVCPRTRRSLRVASEAELEHVNATITAGEAKNLGGSPVTQTLTGGLIPDGEAVVYPVLEGIPVLLAEEAISLEAHV